MTRKNIQNQYKRSRSLHYRLPLLMSKESVCKVMSLRTLRLKTNGIMREFVRRKETGEVGTLIKDKHGKAASKTKVEKSEANHVLSSPD